MGATAGAAVDDGPDGSRAGMHGECDSLEARVRQRGLQVQSLFERLVSAQEEERRRIARDIHDQLGQQMTALRMNIEALRAHVEGDAVLQAHADRTLQLAAEVDQSIDFLVWQLRPAALDHLGLPAALRDLVTGWADRFGVDAAFHMAGVDDARLARDVEANLYRIAQEALHNTAKHAQAAHVTLFLTQQDGVLVLVVDDDGVGFEPSAMTEPGNGSGLGLVSMRERAALIGGRLEIESAPGLGTSIRVRCPAASRAPQAS